MESKALAVVRPDTGPSFAIGDVRQMAESAAQSGLFASIKSKEAAFTLMMLCQAEGLHPMQALRRFDIIQGRPAMKTDAMLGEFQARGGKVKWVRCEPDGCEAVFTAPGLDGSVTVKWTMEDAKRAGLGGKDTWRQYPRQMLRARCVSEGIRMAMPGVVVGLYAPEEVGDFDVPAPKEPTAPPATSAATPTTGEYAAPSSEESARPKAGPAPMTGTSTSASGAEPPTTSPAAATKNTSDLPWYERAPAKMRRLQAAVTKLNLGGAASAGKKGKEREDIVRTHRIEYMRWATGRDDISSTTDLHDEDADSVIRRAEAGEIPS